MTRNEAVFYLRETLKDTLEADDDRDAKRIEAVALAINALKRRNRGAQHRPAGNPQAATAATDQIRSDSE